MDAETVGTLFIAGFLVTAVAIGSLFGEGVGLLFFGLSLLATAALAFWLYVREGK